MAGIRAADPQSLVQSRLRMRGSTLTAGRSRLDLRDYDRVLVVGGGKASLGMNYGLKRVLGKWITGGVVNVPRVVTLKSSGGIILNPSSHPLPSRTGMIGVQRMLSLVGIPSNDDLVICLVSGGASAMMPLPAQGLDLQ